MDAVTIAWFRQDLRVQDNPMLAEAMRHGGAVLPVFISAPDEAGEWAPGGASNWWLHHALIGLESQLDKHGLPLVVRRGPSAEALVSLVHSLRGAGHSVSAVLAGRLYEPKLVERDRKVRNALEGIGVELQHCNGSVLVEPEHMKNRSGEPFRVFTPFWKHLRTLSIEPPVNVDLSVLNAPSHLPDSIPVDDLGLLPEIPWDEEFREHWDPTPKGAADRLAVFVETAVADYKDQRDRPDIDGTSRLSPYLHCGQLGPRQVWAAVHAAGAHEHDGGFTFLSEVVWREFAYHLLHHFPHTTHRPMYGKYADFPWRKNDPDLAAWHSGQTGYPFVDAGMRQLWRTGWMHNRVRMVVASFLVKHLLLPWQDGARWFWDTLVDADLASNTMGWQWVAGSGADAAPYFRIFNPFTQGEKFDPNGDYVREYVPELARLPNPYIHRPWEAPAQVLQQAGVELGSDYPRPIVEHRAGRERALEALKQIRN